MRASVLEKGIEGIAGLIRTFYMQWESSSGKGPVQRLDPRVKVLALIYFLIIVSLKQGPTALPLILAMAVAVALAAGVFGTIWRKVLALGFVFGFLLSLPAALNIITPGEVVIPVVRLKGPVDFWVYHIPAEIGLTRQGLRTVLLLTLRVMDSLALSFLLLYTTPFHEIIRALKALGAPDALLMVVTLSYKYIFIFAKTVGEMHLAKKGRSMGADGMREWAVGRFAFLFRKTRAKCEELFRAMQARGLSEEISLPPRKGLSMADYAVGSGLFGMGVLFLWL